MNPDTEAKEVAAELFMSPAERAKYNETGKTVAYQTSIDKCYELALDQERGLNDVRNLLAKIEKSLPRRSRF